MTDIVERLIDAAPGGGVGLLCAAAVNEIERLRVEVEVQKDSKNQARAERDRAVAALGQAVRYGLMDDGRALLAELDKT